MEPENLVGLDLGPPPAGEGDPMFVRRSAACRCEVTVWRRVIARHGDLLVALPRWTFRACFPPEFTAGMSRFHILLREELAEPLSPSTLSDLRWHFEQLRSPRVRRTEREEERFQRGQVSMIVNPRFRVLYERW